MTDKTNFPDLSNQFLIAMPSMQDPNFTGTVVYICEHSSTGALGLVINRPTDLTLGTLFERLEIPLDHPPHGIDPVFFGGPVHPERGFVLHNNGAPYSATNKVNEELALTTSRDVLQALAQGDGPDRVFVTLGYAGWDAGQLESELAGSSWIHVPAEPNVIFDVPPQERFGAALNLLGIDPSMLSNDVGHA